MRPWLLLEMTLLPNANHRGDIDQLGAGVWSVDIIIRIKFSLLTWKHRGITFKMPLLEGHDFLTSVQSSPIASSMICLDYSSNGKIEILNLR